MNYTEFRPNVFLSQVSFGGAAISGNGGGYGFGDISDKDSIDLLNAALDRGINFFDTAPIYGFGESERKMAEAFKNNREKVHIISKCGVDWHDNKRVNMSNDPKICQKMLDNSLRHLQYIDTYMIHWPDPKVDIRYSLEVLQKAKDKADIKYIGLCNTNEEEVTKGKEVCDIDMIQCEGNLFNSTIDDVNFDGFKMSWATFDKGILTGSVKKDSTFSKEDCRSWAPWWKKSNWKEKVQKVEKLKTYADRIGHSLVEIALGHSIINSTSDTAICGFRNLNQLETTLKAINNLPSKEQLQIAREYLE